MGPGTVIQRLETAVSRHRRETGSDDIAPYLLTRRPAPPLIVRAGDRHGIHVIDAEGQRYLSQFWSIPRPVDLDKLDIVNQESGECNLPQIGVAGGRGRRTRSRQADCDRPIVRASSLFVMRASSAKVPRISLSIRSIIVKIPAKRILCGRI